MVEGYTDMTSWIKLQDSSGVTLTNNISDSLYQVGTNSFTTQLNNQYIGLVQSISSLLVKSVTGVTAIAEVSNLHAYQTVTGNALAGDTGTSLYVADVGIGAGGQKPIAMSGPTVLTGSYGTLTINPNGSYTYAETKDGLTIGQTYDDHFSLTVAGASGGAATSTLDVLLNVNGVGNGGVDNLVGGSTAATMSGFGAGSVLWSGAATDTYLFTSLAQSTPTTQTLIKNFKAGDVIDLSAIDPNFHLVSKFDGHAHELMLVHGGTGNWEIYGDTTGSGTANLAIHLLGVATTYNISASDFHL
jgi:VCBS repeat-containing protein